MTAADRIPDQGGRRRYAIWREGGELPAMLHDSWDVAADEAARLARFNRGESFHVLGTFMVVREPPSSAQPLSQEPPQMTEMDRNFAAEYRDRKQRRDQAEEIAREIEERGHPSEIARLKARVGELDSAASSLLAAVDGLGAFEHGVREIISNTNYACLRRRADELRTLLQHSSEGGER